MSDFMKGVKNKRLEELKNELVAAEVVLGIFRKFKFSAFLQFQDQRLMSL